MLTPDFVDALRGFLTFRNVHVRGLGLNDQVLPPPNRPAPSPTVPRRPLYKNVSQDRFFSLTYLAHHLPRLALAAALSGGGGDGCGFSLGFS